MYISQRQAQTNLSTHEETFWIPSSQQCKVLYIFMIILYKFLSHVQRVYSNNRTGSLSFLNQKRNSMWLNKDGGNAWSCSLSLRHQYQCRRCLWMLFIFRQLNIEMLHYSSIGWLKTRHRLKRLKKKLWRPWSSWRITHLLLHPSSVSSL